MIWKHWIISSQVNFWKSSGWFFGCNVPTKKDTSFNKKLNLLGAQHHHSTQFPDKGNAEWWFPRKQLINVSSKHQEYRHQVYGRGPLITKYSIFPRKIVSMQYFSKEKPQSRYKKRRSHPYERTGAPTWRYNTRDTSQAELALLPSDDPNENK